MTGVLIAVTLISLAASVALLTYVLRLTREERDRSDARAAVLAERLVSRHSDGALDAADRPAQADGVEEPVTGVPNLSAGTARIATSVDPGLATKRTADGVGISPVDSPLHPNPHERSVFFSSPAEGSASPRLLAVAAIGVLVVGLALAGVYVANRPAELTRTASQAAAPLELLSLRHERAGDTLTISGLVGNPDWGQQLQDATILVRTFDRAGTPLASGSGAIDLRRLAPGDESPFVVRVPGASAVGRYRVTFQTAAGVMPHVDRRSQTSEALARGARP